MPTVLDPVAPRLAWLLECLVDRLEHYGVPACRTFLQPGADAPWDACGLSEGGAEGQAWVGIERVYPVRPFPLEDTTEQRCSPYEYAADVVLGVLRCAATLDSNGNPPPVEAVLADSQAQTRDMAIVREALLCCYRLEVDSDPGEFRLGSWEPLGPAGGCVGGQWRATIRVPACPCPDTGA
jgi:hypothetical protein